MFSLSRENKIQRINRQLRKKGIIIRYCENANLAIARIQDTDKHFLCLYDASDKKFYPTHNLPLTYASAHKRYYKNVFSLYNGKVE